MSYSLHVMDTKEGRRFRVYSDGGDYYVSEPLTEDELRDYDFISTIERRVGNALMDHHHEFSRWIGRAEKMNRNRWSGRECPYSKKILEGCEKELERLRGGKISTSFRRLKDGRRILKITVIENKEGDYKCQTQDTIFPQRYLQM